MRSLIICLLVVMLVLYGCGGGKTVVDTPPAPKEPASDPVVEIPQDDFDLGVDDAGADELDQDIEALDEIDIEKILGEI